MPFVIFPIVSAALSSLFRAIHTIKGTAGCLGLSGVESLAHAGEAVLVRARDGELTLTPPRITALLQMGDALRARLAAIEAGGDDALADSSSTAERLAALAQEDPALSMAVAAPEPESSAETQQSAAADGSLRVEVAVLDRLMNLIGELVLARNQILQSPARHEDPQLLQTSQRLNTITTQLQQSVMKTRMQPIGHLWAKLPRTVRDTAASLGKQARLLLDGAATELDKTLLEAIKDPLTHLIRNAIDHGIELPEVRLVRGKPAEGVLRLQAWHEGGQVNIVMSDDGGGIDPEQLKAKAVAKGYLTPEQAARMSSREALTLIFQPGFSTAAQVTAISGRGVGLDVVRINVERIGGTVEVSSTPGRATIFKIKIPLTLAIVPALIVGCGGERYAVPQLSLLEIVRLEMGQAERCIERIRETQLLRLRGKLLPIVSLREALGHPEADESSRAHVVVLQADGRQFGLVVDSIEDTVEIVVKPLGRHLKSVPVFAGATILGDGKIALIVDVRALAQSANLMTEQGREEGKQPASAQADGKDRQQFLLCHARDQGRMAIPLEMVARLEEFELAAIERVAGREVVQHRGEILPLVRVAESLPERRTGERSVHSTPGRKSDYIHVVVHAGETASVGIIVDSIDDILEAVPQGKRAPSRAGVAYVAVIGDRVTEVLDVRALCRDAGATAEAVR